MELFLRPLKKYADFSGRAPRSEYWGFTLIALLIGALVFMLDIAMGTISMDTGVGIFTLIYGLFLLLPSLAVGVRRLHDTGRSGFWLLIQLVPLVGPIVLLIFMLIKGTEGDNAYGPDPLGNKAG